MKRLNSSIGIRIARSIRKASRITFWLGTGCLAITSLSSLDSPFDVPTAALAVTIILTAILIELSALKIGQKLASREFAAEMAADLTDHRMILYLRSFDIAQHSLGDKFILQLVQIAHLVSLSLIDHMPDPPGIPRVYGVEESLDDAIGLNAMFVALGDRLASYGAAKITVKDEDWQNMFYRLANASQLIFMLPGSSAGALWELEQIAASPSLLDKTVFIMPPEHEWALVSVEAAELGVKFPPYRDGCYFRLRKGEQPTEIVEIEPFTCALSKFLASPAYTGVIDFADVLKLVSRKY